MEPLRYDVNRPGGLPLGPDETAETVAADRAEAAALAAEQQRWLDDELAALRQATADGKPPAHGARRAALASAALTLATAVVAGSGGLLPH